MLVVIFPCDMTVTHVLVVLGFGILCVVFCVLFSRKVHTYDWKKDDDDDSADEESGNCPDADEGRRVKISTYQRYEKNEMFSLRV